MVELNEKQNKKHKEKNDKKAGFTLSCPFYFLGYFKVKKERCKSGGVKWLQMEIYSN